MPLADCSGSCGSADAAAGLTAAAAALAVAVAAAAPAAAFSALCGDGRGAAAAAVALSVHPECCLGSVLLAWRAPNQRVDLGGLDLVHAADSVGDLALVSARVDNEDERVVVLNLLHGRLRSKRVLQDRIRIKRVDLRHRLARELRGAQKPEGLWPVELAAVPLLHRSLGIRASQLLGGFLRLIRLLALRERGAVCAASAEGEQAKQAAAGRQRSQAAGRPAAGRRREATW